MKKRLISIIYMFLITFIFTSIVSAVKIINEERIQRNQDIKLQRIILKVLEIRIKEKSSDKDIVDLFKRRVKRVDLKLRPIYVGYEDDNRKVKGFAFPIGGPGFWGPIEGMVAVKPDASEILGIAFYKHTETPGLGGRISEEWFSKQFKGLRLFPIQGDKKIFYLKPAGSGKKENELDAITGATGTSRAVETFVNNELNLFITKLWKSLKEG